jgi:TolB-like protein
MSEVFISYARPTALQAKAAAAALRALGYSVWLDDELPATGNFSHEIAEQLALAKAALVIWSSDAATSDWVMAEADQARQAHKLVQATIDRAPLPMPFGQIHCEDLCDWSGDMDAPAWRKVVKSISTLVAKAPEPAARPTGGREAQALLAVLAFDNLSDDPELAYFSNGVSEEIRDAVARSVGLKVVGRASSFQFRGAGKAAAHVSRQLGATHVLDGSIRRSGLRVRISTELVECATETTLWAERFDRELTDIFRLQDEIAEAVANMLRAEFGGAASIEGVKPAAYDLYLRAGESFQSILDARARAAIVELLEQATRLAPQFARAWALLALVQGMRLRYDELAEPYPVMRAKVLEAGETALKFDPSLGSVHQTLGELEPLAAYAEHEAHHKRALAVTPNEPTVLTNAALFFARTGRVAEALRYASQANQLDPMHAWVAIWCATILDYAGRYDESRILSDKCCSQWPDSDRALFHGIGSAAAHRDWPRFDRLIESARDGTVHAARLRGLVRYGDALRGPESQAATDYLQRARDRLEKTGTLGIDAIVGVYQLGFRDEAFDIVDTASFEYMFDPERRSPNGVDLSIIFSAAQSGDLMCDPRFPLLCSKLGLCTYWVKTESWPDCAEQVRYDFKKQAQGLARGPV